MDILKRLRQLTIMYCVVLISTALGQEITTGDAEQFNVGRQLITQEGVLQWREELEFVKFNNGGEIYWENRLVYGLTKSFGVQIRIPVFLHRRIAGIKTQGMTDILLETQWEFYKAAQHAAVLFTGISFPTGNSTKLPVLGTGSFDAVSSVYFAHSSDHWFFSALLGTQITHKRKRNSIETLPDGSQITIRSVKDGTIISYQYLFGRKYTFCSDSNKIFGLFFELDGNYQFRAKVNDIEIFDSGGNVILFGPFFSFEKRNSYVIQTWIRVPVSQRLFHNKPANIFARPKIEMLAGISMEGHF